MSDNKKRDSLPKFKAPDLVLRKTKLLRVNKTLNLKSKKKKIHILRWSGKTLRPPNQNRNKA